MKNKSTPKVTSNRLGSRELVSCFVCKAPNAKHEITEMSSRCGNYLCDECKQREERANRAMRDLSS